MAKTKGRSLSGVHTVDQFIGGKSVRPKAPDPALDPGENWLLPGGDEARDERLLDKCTVRLRAGDVLPMLTPGGGGWRPPLAPG